MSTNLDRDFRNAISNSDSWLRHYGMMGLLEAKKVHDAATSGIEEYLRIFQKELQFTHDNFIILNYGLLPLPRHEIKPKYNIKELTDSIKEGFEDFNKAYETYVYKKDTILLLYLTVILLLSYYLLVTL